MTNQRLVTQLESRSIFACALPPEDISRIGSTSQHQVLQHQVDVFEKSRNADIILDLAPTGTGKTKAGFTVLLHKPTKSAVYIAPTNALIEQQFEAAKKFVKDANLPHVVKSASAKEIRAWPDDKVGKRPGEKLYNVLRNPATIFPEVGANRPIILVTNPDIFYYATFFAYNSHDRGNIASSFYTKFSTVIFDEFHLYDAKQLVGLLFYLAYSHIFNFFKDGRRIVLLTATPEPACELALQSLEKQGVKIARVDEKTGNGNLLPSQTAVHLELRPQPNTRDEWLAELASEVVQRFRERPKENGAVIFDSLESINRLKELLDRQGLSNSIGRITGPAPLKDRQRAMQCQIILATSTVDVGFNFERNPAPTRQNLDWLIFSTRNCAAFWQRIGRVGRVLGKPETNIDSEAIAYLPAIAWEQGLASLDISGGRNALEQTLKNLPCLEKPFLLAYWRSEAFLEIARPLLELEEALQGIAGAELISQLFETIKSTLGGNRTWDDCRFRMKVLRGAENISKASLKDVQNKWRYTPGGQAFVRNYIKAKYPEDWDDLQAGRVTLDNYESFFKQDEEAAKDLKEFAEIFSTSYAPLFSFRNSLFESLPIRDPHGYLLDESEETVLDPIHLLRYYEFDTNGELLEVTDRARDNYELVFRLSYPDTWQEFVNTELNKLTAFKNCHIERRIGVGGGLRPTPLIQALEKYLIPGVIIAEKENQAIIFQMRREGIVSYPIVIQCSNAQKEYRFLPGIAGILTMAMRGRQLRLPDDEPFIA